MGVRPFSIRVLTALLAAAVVLLAGRAQAAGARPAPHGPRPALGSVDTVQVGPIPAANGFRLYLTVENCGTADPDLQLTFSDGGATATLSHTYSGAGATCTIQRAPARARLRVLVPGFVDVALQIGEVGPALAHPGLPVGCGPPYGLELTALAAGQIDVSIHPAVFGTIAVQTAGAQIFSGGPQSCPARQSTAGREVTAVVGRYILDALQPTHGAAQLQILDPRTDDPSPELQGTLGLSLSGTPALGVDPQTGATRLGGASALTSGSLDFTPLALCPGFQAQDGTLAGTLIIRDPLFGSLALNGADASTAFSGQGTAAAGTCNGPGSEPVVPYGTSTCDQVAAACSVSSGTNVATLFDETSPGTQTITSEAIDFGDGSPPVPISNDGSAVHAYAAAGTYTATLVVTDAVGTVLSSTFPVVIDP